MESVSQIFPTMPSGNDGGHFWKAREPAPDPSTIFFLGFEAKSQVAQAGLDRTPGVCHHIGLQHLACPRSGNSSCVSAGEGPAWLPHTRHG